MIFINGFEEFYGEQNAITAALMRADWLTTGLWAAVAGRANNSVALSGRQCSSYRKFPWVSGKFATGVAARIDGRGSMMWLKSNNVEAIFWLHPDTGLPYLNQSPGGALPTTERWYYYELEIDRATNTAALYINNRLDTTFQLPSGFDAGSEVTVGIGYRAPAEYRIGVTPIPTDSSTKTFDDFYMRDGARIGPLMVTTRFPDHDVNVEWFRAALTGSHAESLARHPPRPLDSYVASDTIGKEDRFTSDDPLANPNAVLATGVLVLARKSPSLNANLTAFMGGQDGAALRQADATVTTDWRTQYLCFEQTGGDTAEGIVGSEFGIKVSP